MVTDRVVEVLPHAVVSQAADGTRTEHPADVLVWGTGFHVTDQPIAERVVGGDGRTLAEHWAGTGMQAHLGVTVAGFPNLVVLMGPNTGQGHTSVLLFAEAQARYLAGLVRATRDRGAFEPRREVQDAWNADLQRRLAPTVWNSGGCRSWYLDDQGRNTVLWPSTAGSFRRRLREVDLSEYVLHPPVPEPVGALPGAGGERARRGGSWSSPVRRAVWAPGWRDASPTAGPSWCCSGSRPTRWPRWRARATTPWLCPSTSPTPRRWPKPPPPSVEHHGRVDAVVANAGVAAGGPLLLADPDAYDRVIEVNLLGSVRTVRAFLPDVVAARGYVLQIASLAAMAPAPLMGAYCASKSGVEAFAHSLRGEVRHHGVDVGVAYLSWTDTDMVRGADEHDGLRRMRERMPGPLGRTSPRAGRRPAGRGDRASRGPRVRPALAAGRPGGASAAARPAGPRARGRPATGRGGAARGRAPRPPARSVRAAGPTPGADDGAGPRARDPWTALDRESRCARFTNSGDERDGSGGRR